MRDLHFSIDIAATPARVWDCMFEIGGELGENIITSRKVGVSCVSNNNGGTEQEVDAFHCRISNQTDKKQSLTQSLSAPCVASFSQSRKSEGTTPRKKIVFDDDDDNPEQEATRELPATRGLKQVKAETGDENAENAHRRSK